MKRIVLSLAVDVSPNATEAEVRAAVERCLRDGLHIFAQSMTPIPHRLTGGNCFKFNYEVIEVAPCR